MQLIHIYKYLEFQYASSVDIINYDFLICGSSSGLISVLKMEYLAIEHSRQFEHRGTNQIARDGSLPSDILSSTTSRDPVLADSNHDDITTEIYSKADDGDINERTHENSLFNPFKLSITCLEALDGTSFDGVRTGPALIRSIVWPESSNIGSSPWRIYNSLHRMAAPLGRFRQENLDMSSHSQDVDIENMSTTSSSVPTYDMNRVLSQSSFHTTAGSESLIGNDPNAKTILGYFAACWINGVISVCCVSKSLSDSGLHLDAPRLPTLKEGSAAASKLSWQICYSISVNDSLHILDFFPDSLPQPSICDRQDVRQNSGPRATIVAVSMSGVCYMLNLPHQFFSTISTNMMVNGGRVPRIPSQVFFEDLQTYDDAFRELPRAVTPLTVDVYDPWTAENVIRNQASLYRFDFKVYTGHSSSRKLCCSKYLSCV